MVTDKIIKKIFEDSEKAEFLEAVGEELPKARRVIICFEKPDDDKDNLSHFSYYQIGFKMTYELIGFLMWIQDLVNETNE